MFAFFAEPFALLMKAGYLLLRFLKFITLMLALAALFAAYYYLPSPVQLRADGRFSVSKEQFFYGVGGFAILLNLVLYFLSKSVYSLPLRALPLPHRSYWLAHKESRLGLYQVLEDWVSTLAVLLNLFLAAGLYALVRTHQTEGQSQFGWLPGLFGVVFGLWLLFLPIRLRMQRSELLG